MRPTNLRWCQYLVVVGSTALPSLAAAQNAGYVVLTVEGEEDVALQPLAAADDLPEPFFTIPPSTVTAGGRESTRTLNVRCFDENGVLITHCDVFLSLDHVPFTGGHEHDDESRPEGGHVPYFGNTGSDGRQFSTVYTAPEVSGRVESTIYAYTQNGVPLYPATYDFHIAVRGLVELQEGANYNLTGSGGAPCAPGDHPGNHWGTATFVMDLQAIADAHAALFPALLPGDVLRYNDMSLVEGGLFDICSTWTPKHTGHRNGANVDMGLVPDAQITPLNDLFESRGYTMNDHGDHWHVE